MIINKFSKFVKSCFLDSGAENSDSESES